MPRPVAAIAAVLAVGLLAGCQSADEETPEPTAESSSIAVVMPEIVAPQIEGFTVSTEPTTTTEGNVQMTTSGFTNEETGCILSYTAELIDLSGTDPATRGSDELNSQALINTQLAKYGTLTASNWADAAFMGDAGMVSSKVAEVSGDFEGRIQGRESMATGQAAVVSLLCPTGNFDIAVWQQVLEGLRVNKYQDGGWPS
jgi:hypothetical protein